MKNFVQRIFQGILSVITMSVLMAAPVAAIIYSAEPASTYGFQMEDAEPMKKEKTVVVSKVQNRDLEADRSVQIEWEKE